LPKILPGTRKCANLYEHETNLSDGYSSPNAFERLAPMTDDYPEVKERQRRDDVPKTKEI
jgi:hypothetical protein